MSNPMTPDEDDFDFAPQDAEGLDGEALFDSLEDAEADFDNDESDIPEHLREVKEKVSPLQVIKGLQDELEKAKDQSLRLAAELENTRRRADKEKLDASKYGIAKFAGALLSVADNFQRALETVPRNEDGAPAPFDAEKVANFIGGIEMTEVELIKVLERNGVTKISPKGEKFDPNLHQAIAQVPGINGEEKDYVVDVAAPGFTIGDRVLRAAMVTVSNGVKPT